jgi:Tfp pilus assembly protein FimV
MSSMASSRVGANVPRPLYRFKHVFDLCLIPNTCSGTMASMSRTNVRIHGARRTAVIAIGLAAALSSMAGRMGAGPDAWRAAKSAPVASRTYVVRPGDTLWRIAAGLVGSREDPRPMVGRLIQLNRVDDGVIVPGQRLRLP